MPPICTRRVDRSMKNRTPKRLDRTGPHLHGEEISCNDLIPMSSEVCSNEPPNRVLGLAGPLLQGRGLLGSEGAEARVGDCPGIGPAGVDPVDLGVHEPEVDRLLVTNLRGRVGGRGLRVMERTGDVGIGGRGGGPAWEVRLVSTPGSRASGGRAVACPRWP